MRPRQHRLTPLFHLLLAVYSLITKVGPSVGEPATPNVVLIVTDDLGYGDLGCFGNTTVRTPHLDKLASQGVRLTHNVATATMCTPSRAAFLTGRYGVRSGMASPHPYRVFIFTASAGGLPASELTIGEVAKKAGYRTAFLGKWHQGWSVDRSDPDHPHPLNQGFDYFYGIPLTNMQDFEETQTPVTVVLLPNLPFQLLVTFRLVLISTTCLVRVHYLPLWFGLLVVLVTALVCGTTVFCMYNLKLLNSFMFRNYDIVEQPIHLPSVTRKLVKESEEFLQARHADHTPFLLIVSWLHVHTALATAPAFRGQSLHGLYGDAVEEMDWGVGQVMDTLDRLGMADNTMVYFTSDHGGSPIQKDMAGNVVGGFNGPFSGVKGDGSTEGSFRVPGIFRWPGHFPAGGVVHEPVSLMDVLPTVAELLNVRLDSDVTTGHVLDGKSLVALLTGEVEASPHDFLFHYCQDSVHAVTYRSRSDSRLWKLMFREPDSSMRTAITSCVTSVPLDPPKLYDLTSDPTASSPVPSEDHPQVVSAIVKAVREHQDSVHPVPSQFTWWRMMWRPWNQPCCNFPFCACQDDKFQGLFADD